MPVPRGGICIGGRPTKAGAEGAVVIAEGDFATPEATARDRSGLKNEVGCMTSL